MPNLLLTELRAEIEANVRRSLRGDSAAATLPPS